MTSRRSAHGIKSFFVAKNLLDECKNFCAYSRPIEAADNTSALLRTETMLSLRSHIVAKAAAALPFNRPCDWSCLSLTKQGPSYPTRRESLGIMRIADRA
jgi:hypothetical protein